MWSPPYEQTCKARSLRAVPRLPVSNEQSMQNCYCMHHFTHSFLTTVFPSSSSSLSSSSSSFSSLSSSLSPVAPPPPSLFFFLTFNVVSWRVIEASVHKLFLVFLAANEQTQEGTGVPSLQEAGQARRWGDHSGRPEGRLQRVQTSQVPQRGMVRGTLP